VFKTSGLCGNEYEDGCLVGCCAVWSGTDLLTFQRGLLPVSLARLKPAELKTSNSDGVELYQVQVFI
jgi:hypothetical protein